MMEYSTVIYEKKDKIAKIWLNRPDKLNALNSTLSQELGQVMAEVAEDAENGEVEVLILTGKGRAFCAGVDLREIQQPTTRPAATRGGSMGVRDLPIPTICAINGFAITGGLELVMGCDILIASEDAKLADTHTRVGIIPGGGMSLMLPRLIGPSNAKLHSFTGNYISAQDALRMGLVSRVVPADELQEEAEKIARDILSCSPRANRKMKQLINLGMSMPLDKARTMESLEFRLWKQAQAFTEEEIEAQKQRVLQRGRTQKEQTGGE